jgi:hypothetical protein
VPSPQLARAVGVVGEQEVVDRVRDAVASPGDMVGDERVDPRGVRLVTRPPHPLAQNLHVPILLSRPVGTSTD